jgi:diguanylate cyclase (GGDEF)-like protein
MMAGSSVQWGVGVLAAAAVYFVANNSLVGVAIALSTGSKVLRTVRTTVVQEALSDCVLLALSPIVIAVAQTNLMFLPLLLLPVLAVYRSASISAEKEHQALHDCLTDLPNRLSFEDNLTRRLNHPRMTGQRGSVLLIDLDRFKEVNDTLGHQAGDALLCLIGPRIVQIVPPTSTVARFGGDEFAVLLTDVTDHQEAIEIAGNIATALEASFCVEEFNLEVQASIGVALFPDHGDTSGALIKHADIAMYVAKRMQTGVELYDVKQDHHSKRRLGLVSDLRKAIALGEIVLYYQPKLDLATGQIAGVEALVRWVHPELGIIPPSDFVPIAEHTGLIRPLTGHVLSTAVQQANEWRASGHELSVAINLSARSLHDGGIVHEVAANLERHGLPARLLWLEITESSIMADPVRARRILAQLHYMGVHLSIDDFGTGYSSLAYLQDLPVREIKIDRSFVANLITKPADQVIVRSTIELAHNLGLNATAEGVEDAATLRWLADAGCDQAQGYHIGRPMPAQAFATWLIDRKLDEDTTRRRMPGFSHVAAQEMSCSLLSLP